MAFKFCTLWNAKYFQLSHENKCRVISMLTQTCKLKCINKILFVIRILLRSNVDVSSMKTYFNEFRPT